MRRLLLAAVLICFILTAAALQAQEGFTAEENKLLALALEKEFAGDGYTVVAPDTSPGRFYREPAARERIKQQLRETAALKGAATDAFIDSFFERNKKPARLTLATNIGNGYLVDYDGKFAAYFSTGAGGDGWKRWRKENPLAHGWTGASIPVMDAKSGLVLIYLGTQYDWLAGGGYLVAYRIVDGKLVELARIMLWIS